VASELGSRITRGWSGPLKSAAAQRQVVKPLHRGLEALLSDPRSLADFEVLLAEQVARLDKVTREVYDRYRVPVTAQAQGFGIVYVIAREGQKVLFYDEVEEEFGTAELQMDGTMEDYGTWGEELSWALRQFPEPQGQ
jgi:hypothetical protein